MGICFEHGLLVADLAWRPSKAAGEAIHAALVRWGLVGTSTKPDLFEIAGAKAKKISGKSVRARNAIPDELVLSYPTMIGDRVRAVMGAYLNEDQERFDGPGVWGMKVVLGRDFKVLDGGDYGPLGAKVLDGTATYYNTQSTIGGHGIPATWSSKPPRTTVVIRDPMTGALPTTLPDRLRDFTGVWRSGLWFDFDKVYPAFSTQGFPGKDRTYGGLGAIPNRSFFADLESAFGTELLEIGRYA